MSRRQLRENERGASDFLSRRQDGMAEIRDFATIRSSARSREMEALDQVQPRAKAKFRKAIRAWVSVPSNVTPDIQSWPCGTGNGVARSGVHLTRGELSESVPTVGGEKETTTLRYSGRSRITPYERRSWVMPAEQRG